MTDFSKLNKLIELRHKLYFTNSFSRELAAEVSLLEDEVKEEMFFKDFKHHFADNCSFDLPIGWYKPFQSALLDMHSFAKAHNIDFKISQVKEKFNKIRIYLQRTDWSNDDVVPLLVRIEAFIEPEFENVCLACGHESLDGKLKNSLCDKHSKTNSSS